MVNLKEGSSITKVDLLLSSESLMEIHDLRFTSLRRQLEDLQRGHAVACRTAKDRETVSLLQKSKYLAVLPNSFFEQAITLTS